MARKAIVVKPKDFENLVNLENKVQIIMGEYAKSEDFSNLLNNNNEEVLRRLNEVLSSLGKLQQQVDGEVTAWFLKGAPCDVKGGMLSNRQPASDWNEDGSDGKDSYASHEGDTYTDVTQFISNTQTPTAGQSWRFCYCEREDIRGNIVTDWHWHKIADSDAIKALQEAAKAQVTADGKTSLFISKEDSVLPSSYNIGDMWIINALAITYGNLDEDIKSGDLLIAHASNVDYNPSDWSKQLRYTDDTVAEQAAVDAQNAATEAAMAREDALIALKGLSDIRSDGRVYLDEMKQLEIQKYNIIEERNELVGEDGNGGEAEKWEANVNYADEYYVAANNAIDSLTYYSDKNNVYQSEEFMYDYIIIDQEGSKPWSAITAYYTERQKLLSQIADATKNNVDTVKTVAEQAVEMSTEAKNKAEAAFENAEKSVKQLDEIDNDKAISRMEMPTLKTQLETIEKEYYEIENSVKVYEDSSVYVELSNQFEEYKSAHYNAVNALKYHCGLEVGEPGEKAPINEQKKSIIIKSTMINPNDIMFNGVNVDYNNIVLYYEERQTILNLISQKAKVYADSLQMELSPENIDKILSNIKIGGVNIIKDSKEKKFINWNTTGNIESKTNRGAYWQVTINEPGVCSFYAPLYDFSEGINDITDLQWDGEYVTASVDVNIPSNSILTASSSHSGNLRLGVVFKNGNKELYTQWQDYSESQAIAYNKWNRLDFTWKMNGDVDSVYKYTDGNDYIVDTVCFVVEGKDTYKSGTVFKFRKVQFEFSTNASSWSPAPEDNDGIRSIALEAQESANSAREASESSITLLKEMADDNYITPQEKITINKEWEEIKYDYAQVDATCEQLFDNIGGERPEAWEKYHNIYQMLDLYLKPFALGQINKDNIDFEFVISVDLSEYTLNIEGEDYNGREAFNKIFALYYSAHNKLMNDIAEHLAHLEVAKSETEVYKQLAEAQQNAAIAANAAANAKAEAEEASERMSKWAEDSVISPLEKSGIQDELERVNSDKEQILSGFTAYELDYDRLYGARYTQYTGLLNGIISALTNNPGQCVDIVSSDSEFKNFRNTQNLYYKARSSALNEISKAADAKAQAAADKALQDALGEDGKILAQAQAAKAAAEAASSESRAASQRLNAWASDSVISPLEKPGIREEMLRIESDYTQIMNQCSNDAYDINTEEYEDIYDRYHSALYSITTSQEENVPIPTDFRSLQSDYYNVRAIYLNTISYWTERMAASYANSSLEAALGEIASAKEEVTALTNEIAQSLQDQIDGKVDSWFMEGQPTTSNKPASNWNIDGSNGKDTYAQHEGDTYTNISSAEDDSTGGQSWRWCRGNASGETIGWHWHKIADSDAVKALQMAAQAQTTADGKRTIFTQQPTTPYKKGDLWVKEGSGSNVTDTFYCKTDRTTGSFTASDWASATAAAQALNAANNALSLAEQSIEEAEIARAQAEASEYITAVLNSGSTDIQGGLILSNVLALKDMNGNVTAGMCGLDKYSMSGKTYTNEVLLWGGGTYNEAFTASKNNYKADTNKFIPTLLKKDGTGKIGVFEIDANKAVVNDLEGNERVAITYNSIDTENIPKISAYKHLGTVNMRFHQGIQLPYTYSFNTETNEDVNFTKASEISYVTGNVNLYSVRVESEIENSNSEFIIDPSRLNKLTIYITLPNGGKQKIEEIELYLEDEVKGVCTYLPYENDGAIYIPFTFDVSSYHFSREVWNKFKIQFETDLANATITYESEDNITYHLLGSRKTCIAPNGLTVVSDNGSQFTINTKLGKQYIIIDGLDTVKPSSKNQLYTVYGNIGGVGNQNVLSELKSFGDGVSTLSTVFNEYLLQTKDLLTNVSQLVKDLDVFCNKIKGSATSEYNSLKTSISKVKSCLAGAEDTTLYTGVDNAQRYGMLLERSAKNNPSQSLPLDDMIGVGNSGRYEKKYLAKLKRYADSIIDTTRNAKLLGLS